MHQEIRQEHPPGNLVLVPNSYYGLVDRNSIWALVMFLYKKQGNVREVLGCVILPLNSGKRNMYKKFVLKMVQGRQLGVKGGEGSREGNQ